ncbi:hypothetical protein I6F35_33465 [Bradyrhizobium sp. BRP22]|uniref:hypothetical protein n=1 Tax=Bradyrhizobium sp. BRP22 TaxID=2793821 RepID=UPI001CD7A3FF|nr:hypothetical protein [Bradyrhizobium sp. BRP22]MCA1458044.1 hypothetical protein [Bradyrhizobium sp. BRP22]
MLTGAIVGVFGAIFAISMVLLGRTVQRYALRTGKTDTATSFVVAMGALIIVGYLVYLVFG